MVGTGSVAQTKGGWVGVTCYMLLTGIALSIATLRLFGIPDRCPKSIFKWQPFWTCIASKGANLVKYILLYSSLSLYNRSKSFTSKQDFHLIDYEKFG